MAIVSVFAAFAVEQTRYHTLNEHHVREIMQQMSSLSHNAQKISIAYPDLFMQFHGKKILLNMTNDRMNILLNPNFCAQYALTIKDQQALISSALVKNALKYSSAPVDNHLVAIYKQYQEAKWNKKLYAGLEIASIGFGAMSWGMALYLFKDPYSKRFWDYNLTGGALTSLSIIPQQCRENASNDYVRAKQAYKETLQEYVAQKIGYSKSVQIPTLQECKEHV